MMDPVVVALLLWVAAVSIWWARPYVLAELEYRRGRRRMELFLRRPRPSRWQAYPARVTIYLNEPRIRPRSSAIRHVWKDEDWTS